MNQEKSVVFRSIWFWWFAVTALYIAFSLLGYQTSAHRLVGGFLGLFVPYGPMSLILFFSPFSWISLVFFIVAMVFADRRLNNKILNLGNRISLNLLILLIITFIVDILRGTPFGSWMILFGITPGL